MDIAQALGWLAAALTIAGAMTTAANLGSRITGWGFVLFALGSAAWFGNGWLAGNPSLVFTNAVLSAINLFGVWRWLGREARHELAARLAARRSRRRGRAALFPASALSGADVRAEDGAVAGTVVDAMLRCDDRRIAYIVVRAKGEGGPAEHLRAIDGGCVELAGQGVMLRMSLARFSALPELEAESWPASAGGKGGPGTASTGPAAVPGPEG